MNYKKYNTFIDYQTEKLKNCIKAIPVSLAKSTPTTAMAPANNIFGALLLD
jgi:hypothetical protein